MKKNKMNLCISEKRKDLIIFFSLLLYTPQGIFGTIIPGHVFSANFFTQIGINLLLLLFFCLYAVFGSRKLLMIVIPIWLLPVILVTTVDMLLYLNLGTYFNYECFQLLIHTNPNEAIGSLKLFFLSFSSCVFLLTYLLAGLILFLPCDRTKVRVITATVFFAGTVAAAYFAPADIFSSIPSVKQRIDNWMLSHIRSSQKIDLDAVNKNIQAVNNEKHALYVLVIGESHSRSHSSLYGYHRKTMPHLEKRKREKGFFYFSDVVSPHSVTLMVLPKLLSLEAHNSDKNFYNSHILIDIFRAAGFKTFYFTSQPENEWYLRIAKRTDCFKFEKTNGSHVMDDALLNSFQHVLQNDNSPKKFIILHLSGSHYPYELRYPPEFKHFAIESQESSFNDEQKRKRHLINHYDNSLRYTDFILNKLFDLIKNSEKNAFALYLPDHGEALGENGTFFGHTEFMPSPQTVEIPMMLYLSREYMRNTPPDKLNAISNSIDYPWNSEDLPFLLIDLARIKYQGFDPRRSLINPMFIKRQRIISGKGTSYEDLKNSHKSSFYL